MTRAAGALLTAILLIAGTGARSASIPLRAQILDDEMTVEIARKVLATRQFNQKQLDATSAKVKVWLSSMGGQLVRQLPEALRIPNRSGREYDCVADRSNQQNTGYVLHSQSADLGGVNDKGGLRFSCHDPDRDDKSLLCIGQP